jgi:predicted phosphodiesterase
VTAVVGNNDGPDVAAWGAAETAALTPEGLPVAMIHDSGPAAGRLPRIRARFPQAELVVFGHSHIPLDAADATLRIFNPGSEGAHQVARLRRRYRQHKDRQAVAIVIVHRPRRPIRSQE